MKTTTLIATAGILGSAAAAPTQPTLVAKSFSIGEFSAGCVPHGTLCYIGFTAATNEMPYSTRCTFSGAPLGIGGIPDVGFATCEDPSIVWSFRQVPVGDGPAPFYELALATAEQSLAAAKFFPVSEFPRIDGGSSSHQQYNGPTRFVVE